MPAQEHIEEAHMRHKVSNNKKENQKEIEINYFVKADEPACLEIEQEAFPHGALSIAEAKKFMEINPFNLAAHYDNQLLGYAFFEKREDKFHTNTIYIYRLAVHYAARRIKVGTSLIDAIKKRLGKSANKIVTIVYEDSLPGHLFLQKNGFRANEIRRDTKENIDMYYFEYFGSEEINKEEINGEEEKRKK